MSHQHKPERATCLQALPNLNDFWPPYSTVNSTEKFVSTVAFDFDEVIGSWLDQFELHAKMMYPNCNINAKRLLYYHPGYDPTVNLTAREFEHCFDRFVPLAKGGYGDLKLIGNIKEQMKQIVDAGIKIKIVTHVPGASSLTPTDETPVHTGIARRVRLEMIERMGLPIKSSNDVEFLAPHAKRQWMVNNFVPLMIEDSIANAASIAEWGLAVLMVPTSYNRGFKCPNVKRLTNRNQIAQSVIEFYVELENRGLLRF